MNPIEYLGVKLWARECGVAHQRAYQVLEQMEIPGAIRVQFEKSISYAIPRGTPWPFPNHQRRRPIPDGYLTLGEWARMHGHTRNAAQAMFDRHGPPEGTKRFGGRFWAIPEDAPWTYRYRGQHGKQRRAEISPRPNIGRKVGGR